MERDNIMKANRYFIIAVLFCLLSVLGCAGSKIYLFNLPKKTPQYEYASIDWTDLYLEYSGHEELNYYIILDDGKQRETSSDALIVNIPPGKYSIGFGFIGKVVTWSNRSNSARIAFQPYFLSIDVLPGRTYVMETTGKGEDIKLNVKAVEIRFKSQKDFDANIIKYAHADSIARAKADSIAAFNKIAKADSMAAEKFNRESMVILKTYRINTTSLQQFEERFDPYGPVTGKIGVLQRVERAGKIEFTLGYYPNLSKQRKEDLREYIFLAFNANTLFSSGQGTVDIGGNPIVPEISYRGPLDGAVLVCMATFEGKILKTLSVILP